MRRFNKTLKISDEAHMELGKVVGELMAKNGSTKKTFDDAIKQLTKQWKLRWTAAELLDLAWFLNKEEVSSSTEEQYILVVGHLKEKLYQLMRED